MVLDEIDFILEHRPGYSYKDLQEMPIFKRRLVIQKIIQKLEQKTNKPNVDQQAIGQKRFKEKIAQHSNKESN